IAHQQGDLARAARLYRQSLQLAEELGEKTSMIECVERLAGALAALGLPLAAAELFGAADNLRAVYTTPQRPTDRPRYERMIAGAGALLDESAWASAWATGRRLSLEATVARALSAA